MKITSTSNQLIKDLVQLKKSSVRKKQRMFLAEGEDFIVEAISSKLGERVFSTEEKDYGLPLTLVSDNVLKKLSVYENSSAPIVLCRYKDEVVDFGDKLIYLDGVQDPGNVGTILRTALAFSYDGVIFSSTSASIYSQKVISSSKGSIFHIPYSESITLEELKNKGYEIIVTSLHDAISYQDYKPNGKFVLVLGNEGQGVCQNTLNLASKKVRIDISPAVESLNVAIAGAILMERYR